MSDAIKTFRQFALQESAKNPGRCWNCGYFDPEARQVDACITCGERPLPKGASLFLVIQDAEGVPSRLVYVLGQLAHAKHKDDLEGLEFLARETLGKSPVTRVGRRRSGAVEIFPDEGTGSPGGRLPL